MKAAREARGIDLHSRKRAENFGRQEWLLLKGVNAEAWEKQLKENLQ